MIHIHIRVKFRWQRMDLFAYDKTITLPTLTSMKKKLIDERGVLLEVWKD